jgi:amino acid adenylation domain-containing protein/non-ribosomal peptide synthase protein (TIGR01720 family)
MPNRHFTLSVNYDRTQFEAATALRLLQHLQNLLEGIAHDPGQTLGQLPVLSSSERQQLLAQGDARPANPYDPICIHQVFEEQVRETPNAVALIAGPVSLSYEELNRRANRLAHTLMRFGVGPDIRVGICLDRSSELVVGILAILKAGGAYVPLDPAYPSSRLVSMLEDSEAAVLLTSERNAANLFNDFRMPVVCADRDACTINAEPDENPPCRAATHNLAYVIYTSGSTGRPKGVLVAHHGLLNLAQAQRELFELGPGERVLQFAPISFDASVSELFVTCCAGACLVLVPAEHRVGPDLARTLRDERITAVTLPPSVLKSLPENELPLLRTIISAGEACTGDVVARWSTAGRRFLNGYGPTEATVCSTVGVCRDAIQANCIGRPISRTRAYILDNSLEPVPIGVLGELYVGGPGLARGYQRLPDVTAEKFIPDPFSGEPGERLYRTGDLVRWLDNGEIEFVGRTDQQVKVSGVRIELGEIERHLLEHQSVREAVVQLQEVGGERRLVAFFVARHRPVPTSAALRAYLRHRLPSHMVPSIFAQLSDMPRTSVGKLDRTALPAATEVAVDRDEPYVAARTPLESLLAEIWGDALGIERIGIHDNFFELGGDSIRGAILVNRLQTHFLEYVYVVALFEAPTIAQFATYLEQNYHAALARLFPSVGVDDFLCHDTRHMAYRLGYEVNAPTERQATPQAAVPGMLPITRHARRSDRPPLSFSQQRLWFLDQLDSANAAYNISWGVELHGTLDTCSLERALNEIVRRHEVLRTSFASDDGRPVQVIAPTLSVPWTRLDLTQLSTIEQESEVRRHLNYQAQLPFDLNRGPLLRATLLLLKPQQHVFLFAMHHIISDGWSSNVLLRELALLYDAFTHQRPSPLPDLNLQYADFAHWQHLWLQGDTFDRLLKYWARKLDRIPPILLLPTDRPRPPVQTFRGANEPFALTSDLSRKLADVARRHDATLFMTLLAAFQLLIARITGQQDIIVGTPIAGRNRSELEPLIGFFVNTLVIRTSLDGNLTFDQLLGRVRDTALDAYAHQEMPFEKLVDALQPQRALSHTPLFQVMFVLQNAPREPVPMTGISLSPLPVETRWSKFDLTLFMAETVDGLRGSFEYNTDLFDDATIRRLIGHFMILLEAIVTDSSARVTELPLLSCEQRREILQTWNATSEQTESWRSVHEQFEQHAVHAADSVALLCQDKTLSYGELNERANQIAHYLRQLGVAPERLVGLYLERSIEMVVAILGVLKAGAGYVPLDAAYPMERVRYMLADTSVRVVLTQDRLRHQLADYDGHVICLDGDWQAIARHDVGTPPVQILPASTAYVIFTSGSSGKPKGVVVTHENLARSSAARTKYYRNPVDRFLLLSSFAFDSSVAGIFWTLCDGGQLVLVPDSGPQDVIALGHEIASRQVTHLLCVPSLFALLLQHCPVEQLGSLQTVIVAGEPCARELLDRHLELLRHVRFFNEYGPTEATVWSTVADGADCEGSSPVPIGRPIANTQVYILDRQGSPVPIGVAGEIHIAGAGVTRGYHGRGDLTGELFVPCPFGFQPGARMYRTGDRGRWLPDGRIEFLGRVDQQVKIRGFRVELAEIETRLGQHPSIREVAVVARTDGGECRLIAYLVCTSSLPPLADLREFLKAQLPDYMVPAQFVQLDSMPLTPSGKVDRRALPDPPETRPELGQEYTEARTKNEQLLSQIWCEVLRLERVGVHDNFFELGGDSILSIQIVARSNRAGLRLTAKQMFEHQTIAELALVAGTGPQIEAEQGEVQGQVPLTPIQHWFFAQNLANQHHWNQSVFLELREQLTGDVLQRAIGYVAQQHDALRLRFTRGVNGWEQIHAAAADGIEFSCEDLTSLSGAEQLLALERRAEELQSTLSLESGPMARAVEFEMGESSNNRLLLLAHHLVVDAVSWRIIVEDLNRACTQLLRGEEVDLGRKTSSFRQWSQRIGAHVQNGGLTADRSHWLNSSRIECGGLPRDFFEGQNTVGAARTVTVALGSEETQVLLEEVPEVYHTQINDLLIAALGMSLHRWRGAGRIRVDLEGHGREPMFEELDVSRTVGWFTSVYPCVLELGADWGPQEWISRVKEQLRAVPGHGVGYGMLRYLSSEPDVQLPLFGQPESEISFNYLGQLHQSARANGLFGSAQESCGSVQSKSGNRAYLLEFVSVVLADRLQLTVRYGEAVHRRETVEALAGDFLDSLRLLINHCRSPAATGYAASDFPLARLDQTQLDAIVEQIGKAKSGTSR